MPAKQRHSSQVKVLFELKNEDGSNEVESVWAVPVQTGYQIDNIPFYAKEVACNDIVNAEPDEDGLLRFTGLVTASGHSTIRLWFASETHVMQERETLRTMGCSSELDLPRLVAVDIPPSVPYESIRAYLDQQESAGKFEYEEACLGQN